MSLVGILDLNSVPNETLVKGFVIRGTWNGDEPCGLVAKRAGACNRVFPRQVDLRRHGEDQASLGDG